VCLTGVTFIATDPTYVKKGAGTLMVAWGLDCCEEQHVLAYLGSPMEAVRFDERLGFTTAAQLSLVINA
jgi:GNAT superfamily N-acetyltransferase